MEEQVVLHFTKELELLLRRQQDLLRLLKQLHLQQVVAFTIQDVRQVHQLKGQRAQEVVELL